MWDDEENFCFDHYFGYGSKHDMEHIKANFCCDCFDEILDQIVPQLKIPLEIEEYDFASDIDMADVNLCDEAGEIGGYITPTDAENHT